MRDLSPYWGMERSKGCPSKGDSEELAASLWLLTLEVVGLNTIKEFCNNSQDTEAPRVPCPPSDKWITYTMKPYPAIKQNGVLPCTAVWMGLESIMLGEIRERQILYDIPYMGASLVAQMVKNPLEMQETWVWSLGWKDPWRRAWQPIPVFLPGESLWTEEPGKLQSLGSQSWTWLSN